MSATEAAGSYKLVNHGKDISAAIKPSAALSLLADGTMSGSLVGRWSHQGNNLIRVSPDGAAAFDGVLSRGWNPNTSAFSVVFSAQSAEGVSLWAIHA